MQAQSYKKKKSLLSPETVTQLLMRIIHFTVNTLHMDYFFGRKQFQWKLDSEVCGSSRITVTLLVERHIHVEAALITFLLLGGSGTNCQPHQVLIAVLLL